MKRSTHIAMLVGAALSLPALWTGPAIAASPAFNCAKAEARVEKLICGDRELALMDAEAERLYWLARKRPGSTEAERSALDRARLNWHAFRNDCWLSQDIRHCIISANALRVHSLRGIPDKAISQDKAGITKGPYKIRCAKLKDEVRATFISSDPPVTAVQVSDRIRVGIGTGTRYNEHRDGDGLQFWTEGKLAYLKLPGSATLDCTVNR